jgi:hypothetical protein
MIILSIVGALVVASLVAFGVWAALNSISIKHYVKARDEHGAEIEKLVKDKKDEA